MLKLLAFFLSFFMVNLAIANVAFAKEHLVASDKLDDKFFKDWLTTSDLMRSHGLDPAAPSWGVITPICLPLQNSANLVPYNRCMYDRAADEHQWPIDDKKCTNQAKQEYPDSLMKKVILGEYVVPSADGKNKTVYNTARRYNSWDKLHKDRNEDYKNCMKEKDWKKPDDWTSGRLEK